MPIKLVINFVWPEVRINPHLPGGHPRRPQLGFRVIRYEFDLYYLVIDSLFTIAIVILVHELLERIARLF